MMKNEELVELVYDQVKHRLNGMPIDKFAEATSRFKYIPVEVDSKTVGAIMIDGNEWHIAVMPEYRKKWATKGLMKFFKDAINKHGKIVTAVSMEHDLGHGFARKLGFKNTQTKDGIVYYEATI